MWTLFLLFLQAWAGARVEAILVEGPGGELRPLGEGRVAPDSWVARAGGEPTPIAVGLDLEDGDRVVARGAIVTLRPDEGWEITLYPGAEVEVGAITWVQHAGQVLYRVRAAFSVQTERFDAMVEGTRFLVSLDPAVEDALAVREGKVRVRNALGEALAERGDVAVINPGQAPTLAGWTSERRNRLRRGLRRPLRLPVEIGLLVGGGSVGASPAGGAEAMATLRLPGLARLVATAGWREGERAAPIGLGVEFGPGGWSLGADLEVLSSSDTWMDDQGREWGGLWIVPAGSLSATGRLPLAGRWALAGRLELGGEARWPRDSDGPEDLELVFTSALFVGPVYRF